MKCDMKCKQAKLMKLNITILNASFNVQMSTLLLFCYHTVQPTASTTDYCFDDRSG